MSEVEDMTLGRGLTYYKNSTKTTLKNKIPNRFYLSSELS